MPFKSQVLSPRSSILLSIFIKVLLWVCGVLTFLTAIRLTALAFYSPTTGNMAFTELLQAFLLGFRFDLSAMCYVLVVPVVTGGPWLALAPHKGLRAYEIFLRAYLTLMTFVIAFISVIDLVYYSYFQDHINVMIFGFFEDDTMALVRTLWKNYPVVWVFGGLLAFTFFLWIALRRLLRFPETTSWSKPQIRFLPVFFLVIFLLGLGARGGFGLFPLGVADATISSQPFVNYLAFSGLHSLHRAVKLRLRERSAWNINAKTFGYHDARSAARDYLQKPDLPESDDPLTWFKSTTPKNLWAEKTRPHVVILMMESFGSYWLRENSASFNLLGDLAAHFREDLVFLNFLPSMSATIGSLSALMINTPHRPQGGFLTESRYLQVPFRTAPARVYAEQGYRTRFVYGGAVGWRDIDKFARTQGFESIEGDFQIESKLGRTLEKHDWGLYDGDVWEYLDKTLTEATTPELVVVMTTTNHPPYQLPKNYHPLPLEIPKTIRDRLNIDADLAKKRFLAYQYANHELGLFLSKLKASPLGEKTLLAATGDHGFLIVNFDDSELLQKWQVPLYLYLPSAIRPKKVDTNVFGSHTDIFPTLMPLSLSEAPITAIGTNLLDASQRHDAFHSSSLAIGPAGATVVQNADRSQYYHWRQPGPTLEWGGPTPELQTLSTRYKGLMSFLDEFYEFERKRSFSGP